MIDREAWSELGSMVRRRATADLLFVLQRHPWPVNSLQMIGEGLLAAIAVDCEGSVEFVSECLLALRERRWEGDHELAAALEGALGTGPAPVLRPLTVDLEELTTVLEGDPANGGGRTVGGPAGARDLRRGAFRRFGDVLSKHDELWTLWHAFSGDRKRGWARSWLAGEGYAPASA